MSQNWSILLLTTNWIAFQWSDGLQKMAWEMKFGIKASCRGCGEVSKKSYPEQNIGIKILLNAYYLYVLPNLIIIHKFDYFL